MILYRVSPHIEGADRWYATEDEAIVIARAHGARVDRVRLLKRPTKPILLEILALADAFPEDAPEQLVDIRMVAAFHADAAPGDRVDERQHAADPPTDVLLKGDHQKPDRTTQ